MAEASAGTVCPYRGQNPGAEGAGALYGGNGTGKRLAAAFILGEGILPAHRRMGGAPQIPQRLSGGWKIKEITNHDATLFHGEGCFEKQPRHLIYSVISGDEKNYLINEIKHKDPDSFVNIVSSKQILGKFYRKPND